MPGARVNLTPKRSVAFFAALAILMVGLSYVVLLLVAASCVYFPYLLLANSNSVQFQLALLFLGGVAVACALLWSVVPRRDHFAPPGPLIERAEHPKLFREIDEIAGTLNEKLPSEVYLIGDANAYVADRGGLLGMGDRRVLCLGLPLLATLTVSELRAVLAHEFAHFYSGDTALGPWVFKAHTALVRSFQSLVGLRAKVGRIGAVQLLFALVILVLNHYFTFFLRVTNFISRQQEFRSDELACIVAGKWPCSRGLEKVHAAGMLWPAFWMGEVAPLLELKCIPDIGDGFRRFLASPAIAGFIEASLKAEQESKETDPFSSHPPFSERIEALRRMQLPQPEGDDALASSLFDDPQSLELMFIEKMNPNIPHNSLRRAPWNDLATLVTIPYWHSEIAKFGTLLLGKKAVALPELAKQLPQIGSHMPDPKGRLLTPAQRTERAEQLLSRAVGLLLLEKGWQLKREPAVAEFRRSDETVDPFALVADVVAGKVSAEEWASKCVALGIAEETLGAVSSQPVPSATA